VTQDERALLRTVGRVADLLPAERLWVLRRLTVPEKRTLDEFWPGWAHDGQLPPHRGQSHVTVPGAAPWLILAGRGFGKTRAGAEWVLALARTRGDLRIALVGATLEDARKVMVTGKSGLLAVARTGEELRFSATEGVVRFPSGAEAFLYSGACPEKLRGPEHHFAWCDEIAKWRHAEAAWDNLQLGLRLGLPARAGTGSGPRALVTTTPKASALLERLVAAAAAAGTLCGGRMADNPNLPADFVAAMEAAYRGTRKGREELDGELVLEAEGALWSRGLLERCRVPPLLPGTGRGTAAAGGGGGGPLRQRSALPPPRSGEEFRRIVIGVDPPASAEGDACGIVACGVDAEGTGWVLGDHSVGGLSPEGWASAVVAAAEVWGADCAIVERNQGGDMVKAVLRAADAGLPVRTVFARFGKGDRAEPVAMLFETGRVRLAGSFPALEDELCAMIRGGGYARPGRSPDRADAMVWALTELLLGKARVEPAVRGF
jgi:phage terminase large subunit-like protein